MIHKLKKICSNIKDGEQQQQKSRQKFSDHTNLNFSIYSIVDFATDYFKFDKI